MGDDEDGIRQASAAAEEFLKKFRKPNPPNIFAPGLRKVCPRCKRAGHVFLFKTPTHEGEVGIVAWEGPARGTGPVLDLATCSLDNLLEPAWGCGYDGDPYKPSRQKDPA